eukprot:2634290-Prymnesium_polylepis.1
MRAGRGAGARAVVAPGLESLREREREREIQSSFVSNDLSIRAARREREPAGDWGHAVSASLTWAPRGAGQAPTLSRGWVPREGRRLAALRAYGGGTTRGGGCGTSRAVLVVLVGGWRRWHGRVADGRRSCEATSAGRNHGTGLG